MVTLSKCEHGKNCTLGLKLGMVSSLDSRVTLLTPRLSENVVVLLKNQYFNIPKIGLCKWLTSLLAFVLVLVYYTLASYLVFYMQCQP